MDQTADTPLYDGRRLRTVGEPKESQGQTLVGRQRRSQCLLMAPPGFAQLTLRTVAVDSMPEMALRHADKHLHRRLLARAFLYYINHPNRKSSQGMAATSREQLVDQTATGYSLVFPQRQTTIRHLASANSAAGHPSSTDTSPSEPEAEQPVRHPERPWQ